MPHGTQNRKADRDETVVHREPAAAETDRGNHGDFDSKSEHLPLSKAAQFLLEECRTVLPGIQALFGFQLIAVFNSAFFDRLSPTEQRIHLTAIALVAVAVALVMTPAALHRASGSMVVTERFVHVSSRLLRCSMFPLACAINIDSYLIARVILMSYAAALLAAALLGIFVMLWFVLPKSRQLQRMVLHLGATRHEGP